MKCRFCQKKLEYVFADLDEAPLSNSYVADKHLFESEDKFPLKVLVCDSCWLVQTVDFKKSAEIFNSSYAYFSSMSKSWLEHSRKYVDMIVRRLKLGTDSFVTEIASNDGYLLQYMKSASIPCQGVEPTASTAAVSKSLGIETVEDFFGESLAQSLVKCGKKSDLILGNNVLAHVPDINDFVIGLRTLLKDGGTVTMEFPHLLNLIRHNQFDTIYHEHFSYLSLISVIEIFKQNGLDVYDVEKLTTHGGSLRIYAGHKGRRVVASAVLSVVEEEVAFGLQDLDVYTSFQDRIKKVCADFCDFIELQKHKTIVAYGAAAKGNTLLNYCQIKNDAIGFVADRAPSKQGKFLPGSHIPVVKEDEIMVVKPDYVVIFPWNICDEIIEQLIYIREWGGKFVCAIPHLRIL